MRRTLLPAGLAILASLTLVACGGSAPTPTPSATESSSPEPTAPTVEETVEPTTVGQLPSSALLRVSVTAEVGEEKVRLQLTVARAAGATTRPVEVASLLEECPNTVSSQLELLPGFQPVGVLTSVLTTEGDWPEGLRFAVAPGGVIASVGEGVGVEPTQDPVGQFGCIVPIVSGPGDAKFVSILVGDPAQQLRTSLDAQVSQGLFGFEETTGSVPVRWTNCVVQLSSVAERFAQQSGWLLPTEWGAGCLIGDGGGV